MSLNAVYKTGFVFEREQKNRETDIDKDRCKHL